MPIDMIKTDKNWPKGCINNEESKFPKILELWANPILIPKYFTSRASILDKKLM